MPLSTHLNRPSNRQLHNLLGDHPLPRGAKATLGLGLNYCTRQSRPTNDITASFERLRQDARRIDYVNNKIDDPDAPPYVYNPKLYLKSEYIFEEPIDEDIEGAINNFERAYRQAQRRYNRRQPGNLTPRKFKLLHWLFNNDIYIVVDSDKGLGPCILLRDLYIRRAIKDHLGNKKNYKIISPETALRMQHRLRAELSIWLDKFSDSIPLNERTFLLRALDQFPDKFARFRMNPKIHKFPWTTRPIIACAGTFMNFWSKWLDFHLQRLIIFIPTYVKDTQQIIDELRAIDDLPPNTYLVTADADAMYDNIDTDHAIEVISAWLDELSTHPNFPKDFPLAAVKWAMATIMRNNIFTFGVLHFLQLLGTAMGTSAAVMWATMYFAYWEVKRLLPRYRHLLYKGRLRRFIDDLFAIWICDKCTGPCCSTCPNWTAFKADLNGFGQLRWTINEPAKTAIFLDLTITIEDSRIITRTYQKPMNLFLYLPGPSAHPHGTIKGTIYGMLRRYRQHNTYYADYLHFTASLYRRLLARAHRAEDIRPIFLEAHEKIKHETRHPPAPKPAATPLNEQDERQLFFHAQYHPGDIPRSTVRRLYDQHCGDLRDKLKVLPPIIAYTRPKNIRDLVSRTKLHEAPGKTSSRYPFRGSMNKG